MKLKKIFKSVIPTMSLYRCTFYNIVIFMLIYNKSIYAKNVFNAMLLWHEKASRTALQTSAHTLLVQTHNMTIFKVVDIS